MNTCPACLKSVEDCKCVVPNALIARAKAELPYKVLHIQQGKRYVIVDDILYVRQLVHEHEGATVCLYTPLAFIGGV